MTLGFVQQSLIHEEQKINEKSKDVLPTSSFSSMDMALIGERRRDRSRKALRCFGFHEIGHIRRNCPKGKRDAHRAKIATEERLSNSDSDGIMLLLDRRIPWQVAGGFKSHMKRKMDLLIDYDEPERVGLSDDRSVEAICVGNVHLCMLLNVSDATVCQVLYVPKLAYNLFSVRAAAAKENSIKFRDSRSWIRDRNGKLRNRW